MKLKPTKFLLNLKQDSQLMHERKQLEQIEQDKH